jgi:hypothetical protein
VTGDNTPINSIDLVLMLKPRGYLRLVFVGFWQVYSADLSPSGSAAPSSAAESDTKIRFAHIVMRLARAIAIGDYFVVLDRRKSVSAATALAGANYFELVIWKLLRLLLKAPVYTRP